MTIQASAQMSGDPQPSGVRQTQLVAACADKIWPLVNKASSRPSPDSVGCAQLCGPNHPPEKEGVSTETNETRHPPRSAAWETQTPLPPIRSCSLCSLIISAGVSSGQNKAPNPCLYLCVIMTTPT